MVQDQSQKFFFWGIMVIVGVFILAWLLHRKHGYCQNQCWECDEKESYSPYRQTGGCSRTGNTYLDAYKQEDYYQKYPYIYPTPTSYTRAWYANRRANTAFLQAQKLKMEQNES